MNTISPSIAHLKSVAYITGGIVAGLVVGMGVHLVLAWNGPSSSPPPANNVSGILIDSALAQYKLGALGINTSAVPSVGFGLGVGGNVAVGGKIYSASTVATDLGSTVVTKDYVDAKSVGSVPTTYFTRFTYTASDGVINCHPFGGSCTFDGTNGKYNGKIVSVLLTGDDACAMNGGKCMSVGYGADKYAFCGANVYQYIANTYSDPIDRWSQWAGLGAQCIK